MRVSAAAVVALSLGASVGWLPRAHAADGPPPTGHIAVWHHHRAVVKTVTLPLVEDDDDEVLADDLVEVGPLPDDFEADAAGCYCFGVGDDRLAYVHTYYYAHQVLAGYNALLHQLRLPQLRDVMITLKKDATRPTTGRVVHRRHPRLELTFASPAVDPFVLARELGRLVDTTLSPRHHVRGLVGPDPSRSLAGEAEAAGVDQGVANILAALELGESGSLPATDNTLDAPPLAEVDTFVRIPDLVLTRREALRSFVEAPRFAARYADYVATVAHRLSDPAWQGFLEQPDEDSASAALTQPLWQAAVRFGFRPVEMLVLKTVANWSSPETTYLAFGRELVAEALVGSSPASSQLADFLAAELRRRGLPVQETHLDAPQH